MKSWITVEYLLELIKRQSEVIEAQRKQIGNFSKQALKYDKAMEEMFSIVARCEIKEEVTHGSGE